MSRDEENPNEEPKDEANPKIATKSNDENTKTTSALADRKNMKDSKCSKNLVLVCTKRLFLVMMAILILGICAIPMIIAIGLSQQCSAGLESGTFSQFPGFAEYLAQYPPSETLPTEEEQALLTKYRPRVYLAANQTPFIDFYQDYIAHGALYDRSNGSRRTVANSQQGAPVNQTLLNAYKNNPHGEFAYSMRTSPPTSTSVVYGRVDYDTLQYQNQSYPFTFLTYNLVFAHSGLIEGLDNWQKVLMGLLVGDRSDWHQLDHYVGFTLALYQGRPLAVTLQQHNYQVTKLIIIPQNNQTNATDTNSTTGADTLSSTTNNNNTDTNTNTRFPSATNREGYKPTTIILPPDNRLLIDVALQSNEIYPHPQTSPTGQPLTPILNPTLHPALSFITASNMEFFLTSKNKPMMAGYDQTYGQMEQQYELKFLPQSDAFYTFAGRLGERRQCLPGRDGPPGAMYVTLPALSPYANRMVFGYMPGTVKEETVKMERLLDGFRVKEGGLVGYMDDFVRDAFGGGR